MWKITEWPERRAPDCGGAKHSAVSAQKPHTHSTTSVTMADPPSHPPQTPHDARRYKPQSVADANQAAPSPESSPTPTAPVASCSTPLCLNAQYATLTYVIFKENKRILCAKFVSILTFRVLTEVGTNLHLVLQNAQISCVDDVRPTWIIIRSWHT